jgi:hypothetical protein
MELWELEAREQVRDTLARYNHAGDRGLLEELAGCFLPDGVLEVKDLGVARGRAEIVGFLSAGTEEGRRAQAFVRHHLSSVRIETITRDRAQAAAYFVVMTAAGPDHWGRYRDVLRPHEGRWLMEHRRVTVDAAAPGSYLAVRRSPASPIAPAAG